MSAAESAKRVPVVGGARAGDWTRELEGEGRVDDLLYGGGSVRLLSGGAGEGPRLRGGSDGVALLPSSTLVLVPLPTTRWIKLSTVVGLCCSPLLRCHLRCGFCQGVFGLLKTAG